MENFKPDKWTSIYEHHTFLVFINSGSNYIENVSLHENNYNLWWSFYCRRYSNATIPIFFEEENDQQFWISSYFFSVYTNVYCSFEGHFKNEESIEKFIAK